MLPQHVAIIMDGNGRWAKKRFLPRIAGHRMGVKAVRRAIQFCVNHKINTLTLYALSVENFLCRPETEIKFLIGLLADSIQKNMDEMHAQNIRMRIVGDHTVFGPTVREQIERAQSLTKNNTGLNLVVALHYSGRWDIVQAAQQFAQHAIQNNINPATLTETDFAKFLCLHDLPEPDLMIRTSGEQRISNFMLWQFAYTELYFIDTLWPDFDDAAFENAITEFQKRDRRYGKISEQICYQPE
ncbi:MAG TPA: polyprenyl diphosphate synthase [Coxiellaceae bacterium]|nr:MAG: di-trans,poly-cis-decaprenylcistransferase [Gammaproteobacteria bacterium RIFCSPHIGHO2_12_FULL_36_30]HLB57019.1 polyprenyl diphosphate synthase [Coxiellaceae bacterium]